MEIRHVVKNIDLHVKPGRIYGILGRNGAGKTTIMKMIWVLLQSLPAKWMCSARTSKAMKNAFIPVLGPIIETPAFTLNLTGTENIEIFAKLRGTPRPNAVQERTGSRGASLPGQKAVQQVFSRYEAAPRHCQRHPA